MDFLIWLEGTRIAILVSQTLYGYPLLETLHAIGMAMLIGSLGLLNARVLGLWPALPVWGVRRLLPLAWAGFALNAGTGVALFMSLASEFYFSTTFRVKMVLVLMAGINAWLLSRHYLRNLQADVEPMATPMIRAIAGSALLFWFGALIAGRLLAYAP